MTRPAPGRLLGLAVVGLLLSAAALWGASRGTWLTAVWDTSLRGRVTATATGADTEAVLVPWALLALAAVAGILATSGWGRRVVGTVVALAGAWAALRGLVDLAPPPPDALPLAARRTGQAVSVAVSPAWPLLAAVGGLLMAGVGALVVLRAPVLPRLGARYDAPGTRRRVADPDRALWDALDEGRDPTSGAPPDATAPPRPEGPAG